MSNRKELVAADYSLREGLHHSDLPHMRKLVRSTGNFTDGEVDVAEEVADDYLQRGEKSGYCFLRCMLQNVLYGFCCFGPIPCTVNRFEIYWIVVDGMRQQSGIGTLLLRESEKRILTMGGSAVYLDTSSKDNYRAAREFYEKNGYRVISVLDNFYSDGDDKIIYRKEM